MVRARITGTPAKEKVMNLPPQVELKDWSRSFSEERVLLGVCEGSTPDGLMGIMIHIFIGENGKHGTCNLDPWELLNAVKTLTAPYMKFQPKTKHDGPPVTLTY